MRHGVGVDVVQAHRAHVGGIGGVGPGGRHGFIHRGLRQGGPVHDDGLDRVGLARGLEVGAAAGIGADDDPERLGEVLLHLVDVLVAFAAEGIAQVRGLDGSLLPFVGESRLEDAHAFERIGQDAEQTVDDGPGGDADVVGEIAVGFVLGLVVVADLAEIARAQAQVHLVQEVRLQEPEAGIVAACLQVGERHVGHLGVRDVVGAPDIGHPVGGGDGEEVLLGLGQPEAQGLEGPGVVVVADRDVGDLVVHVDRGAVSLLRRAGAAVDRGVDGPDGRVGMDALQAHEVLELGPMAQVVQPQPVVHGLQDGLRLFPVRGRVLADDLGDAGRLEVREIIVGRGVGDGAAVVVEGVAGPDAAVGVVEMVPVGVEIAFLPLVVQHDVRPHLAHELRIGIIAEVAHHLVDVVEVHVVVADLVGAARGVADIAVGVHRRAPLALGAREVVLRSLLGMLVDGRDVGHHRGGVGRKMGPGAVVPAHHVARVGAAPAQVMVAPAHGAVQVADAVPDAVTGMHHVGSERIEEGVRGVDLDHRGQLFPGLLLAGVARLPGGGFGHAQGVAAEDQVGDRGGVPGDDAEVPLVGGSLEILAGIHAEVAVTAHLGAGDAALLHLQHGGAAEAVGLHLPDGALLELGGEQGDAEFTLAPGVVPDLVAAASALVAGLAPGGRIQLLPHPVQGQVEAEIPAVIGVEGGEDRAVARLHAETRVGAVQGAGVAVVSVEADDLPAVGEVVHRPDAVLLPGSAGVRR